MQQPLEKRKRSANFSEEEKLRFVRLLQEKGDIIITKVTSHDTQTNKRKEEAWEVICRGLNSSGSVLRNTDTLKKLWQKLKSDAKVFKSVAGQQVRGTGGGPSINMNNPVLELVVEMTGRGSSGIAGVSDCDSYHLPVRQLEILRDDWDECKPPSAAPQPLPPTPPAAVAQVPLFDTSDVLEENSKIVEEGIEVPTYNLEPTIEADKLEICSTPVLYQKPNLKRRRPLLDKVSNERSGPVRAQINYSNSFASERLRSERAKLELINLKSHQETELHKLRMENEQRLHSLKEKILKKILQKVEDGDQLDADIIRVAFSSTIERSKEK